ncbi:GNAT family [Colletotrichum truncatum]|uniref:GNAT family n=1 Tax=Colletotrichum truncatum TaxID=5467 RepID=A0ACC3ZI66_COLTU|nr:GNAT family [Colletotrichum truncatum]KAF6782292.1 GNAT family [Colletotrichum truncatum]
MAPTMRPATTGDGPALAAVYLSAFSDNPVAKTCFPPDSPECRQLLSEMFAEEVSDARSHVFVITDPDYKQDPDLVIAWAKWVRPARDGEANVPPPPPQDFWPVQGNPEFANRFFGTLARRHAAIMGDVRHWYLELVVSRKDHQGKGAATPLLRWGCGRAEEEGVPIFLESMPKAKAVYEKYGFQTVDYLEFQVPSGETISQDFMLRKGKNSKDNERILENVRNTC